jgi:hypothetical protein
MARPAAPTWLTRVWPELVVAAAVVGVFAEAVFTRATFFARDIAPYELPLRTWWRDRILAGELPEWIPNLGFGIPVIANPVTQAFYPFNLAMLLPLPAGLDLYIVGHLALAGVGASRLARRMGADATGACVAGVVYALGGYLVSMTTNPFYVVSDAYIPWIALAVLHLRDAPEDGRRIGMVSLLVGMQLLAGAFQGALLSVGLAFVLALLTRRGAHSPPSPHHLTRFCVLLGVGVVLASLLAAAQIVPALLLETVSTRAGGMDLDGAQSFSTHPLRLLNVFVPGPFGVPFIGPYYGGHLEKDPTPFPWAYSLYSGAACSVLIPIVIARFRTPTGRNAIPILALLGLAGTLALGVHTPAYGWAFRFAPLLDRFRFPEKFFSLGSLLTAVLCGLGVTIAFSPCIRARQLWPGLLGLALPASAALAGLLFPDSLVKPLLDPGLNSEQLRQGALHFGTQAALATGVAAATLACLAYRQRRLLVLLLVSDLAVAAFAIHRTTDLARFAKLVPQIAERVRRAEALREPMRLLVATSSFIHAEPATFEPIAQALGFENRGVEQGLHVAFPYTSATVLATNNLLLGLKHARGDRVVRKLRATSIVTDTVRHQRGMFGGGRIVARWGEFVLLDVPDPSPRAYAVFRAATVRSDKDAVELVAHPHFPAERVAVFVGEIPHGVPQLKPPETPPPPRACPIATYQREYVAFECDLDLPGVAILADQFIEGWELRVDARPAVISRVDVAFRGVTLPAGRHRLEYRYRTPGLTTGLVMSSGGLVAVLALLWPKRRARAASREPEHTPS